MVFSDLADKLFVINAGLNKNEPQIDWNMSYCCIWRRPGSRSL